MGRTVYYPSSEERKEISVILKKLDRQRANLLNKNKSDRLDRKTFEKLQALKFAKTTLCAFGPDKLRFLLEESRASRNF